MKSAKHTGNGTNTGTSRARLHSFAVNLAGISLLVLATSGCIHDNQAPRVAGWAITDPTERHPILVSQQPTTLSLRVPKGSHGLTPQQRAQTIAFVDRYRGVDAGNSRLVILAPSGSANEIAAMHAVGEIRSIVHESGFDEASVVVEAYRDERSAQPAIRVSYLRYVAEGPRCGHWGSNLAEDPLNVGVPNLGCATQANFAAQVANPADLLGPRSMTPRSGERRDQTWDKYVKGESTVARKTSEEKVQVKGAE